MRKQLIKGNEAIVKVTENPYRLARDILPEPHRERRAAHGRHAEHERPGDRREQPAGEAGVERDYDRHREG